MAATAAPRPVTPVGILAAELGALAGLVAGGELATRLRRAAELAGGLEPYVSACTTPESAALRALSRRTAEADWSAAGPLEAEMLSGHVEGQALRFLVRMTRARRVLEVGMFTGYSALAMAEALPDGGEVVACELDPGVAAFARESFAESAAGARIRVEVGDAHATLDRLAAAGERFDLAFVDAEKGGYGDYVGTVLDAELLAPEGVIAVDNTLMQGEPWREGARSGNGEAIAAFNRALVEDPRVEQVLLPLRDGLTLIRRA